MVAGFFRVLGFVRNLASYLVREKLSKACKTLLIPDMYMMIVWDFIMHGREGTAGMININILF